MKRSVEKRRIDLQSFDWTRQLKEEHGEDRAKYGANLIGKLASKLKDKGLKGFSISALKNHRTFYLLYPQISQSVIGLFQISENEVLKSISLGDLKIEKAPSIDNGLTIRTVFL
jgi:hypothetical protein